MSLEPPPAAHRPAAATFDCRTCGACCGGWEVEVEETDDVDPALVKEDRVCGLRMRERSGMCVAFRGTVGKKARCSIYASRPKVCRAFEPGSDDCLVARARSGILTPTV